MTDQNKPSEHTPGPWSIDNHSTADKDFAIDGATSFGNVIAYIYFDDCDHEEQDANAALVARAPELLAENERLKEALGSLVHSDDDLCRCDACYLRQRHSLMGNKKLRFIDLFAGIGGFRLAAERLGLKCVFSSEKDEFAAQTYMDNFGDRPSGDINDISVSDIPHFNILFAGFPCQPFSYAGRNEGFKDQERGTLFYSIAEIIHYHKPEMFLLENVKGLKSHDKGRTLKVILKHLDSLGYKVYQQIISSYDFGVPQHRQRWYCVGFLRPRHFEFPEGGLRGTKLRDIIDTDETDPSLNISQFESDRIDFHFRSTEERVEHDSSMYKPHTKKGRSGVFSYMKPDNCLRFHVGDAAKTQIQEAYYTCLDGVAPTIIANRVPKMWDLRRRLSVKECLRLQGFPDDFTFTVSNGQAYKQLGNSVTVPVISRIISNMVSYHSRDIPAL